MKRTVRIMRIGIISTIFRGLIVGAMTGFILGVIGAFWWSMVVSALTMATGIDLTGAGYGMLVLLPLAGMAACGVLGMSIMFPVALFYNLTAGLFGGVTVEVEEDVMTSSSSVPAHDVPAYRHSRRSLSGAESPSVNHRSGQ